MNTTIILIDCSPSLGMLTINALACADEVIIPVQAAYLPVKGLEQLIRTIGKVRRQLNRQLEIGGILITMVDNRTNYARDISELILIHMETRFVFSSRAFRFLYVLQKSVLRESVFFNMIRKEK